MRFYDSKDETDLKRVEAILHKGGIEYTVMPAPPDSRISAEICVAEEDIPAAEELLLEGSSGK